MKLFDLHCDTAYEMFKNKQDIISNSLAVDIKRAEDIEEYRQVMAFWCDSSLSDEECYADFIKTYNYLMERTKIPAPKGPFMLSVEDARLLCGELRRLERLYEMGIRFLIPVWGGKSIIGGAFDEDVGLTDFGKNVIRRCFELGIVPDISHASLKTADEMFEIAEYYNKPIIASHSCSYSVYDHPRNLRDEQFERIKKIRGIVGLSFCSYHLAPKNEECTSENILLHIERYLELGGEDIICLGADMDGAPLPSDLLGIQSIPMIYEKICDRFGKNIADKITFDNANNFVNKNFNI